MSTRGVATIFGGFGDPMDAAPTRLANPPFFNPFLPNFRFPADTVRRRFMAFGIFVAGRIWLTTRNVRKTNERRGFHTSKERKD